MESLETITRVPKLILFDNDVCLTRIVDLPLSLGFNQFTGSKMEAAIVDRSAELVYRTVSPDNSSGSDISNPVLLQLRRLVECGYTQNEIKRIVRKLIARTYSRGSTMSQLMVYELGFSACEYYSCWVNNPEDTVATDKNTRNYLEKLKGVDIKLGVVTRGPRVWLNCVMQHLGLSEDFFCGGVRARDEYRGSKAVAVSELTDRLGIDPADTLFFDDEEHNLEAVRSVGVKSIKVDGPSFLPLLNKRVQEITKSRKAGTEA
jgi:FMN phosphatase YigB (HAD superfamily)